MSSNSHMRHSQDLKFNSKIKHGNKTKARPEFYWIFDRRDLNWCIHVPCIIKKGKYSDFFQACHLGALIELTTNRSRETLRVLEHSLP